MLFAEVVEGTVVNIHDFPAKPDIDESVLLLIEVNPENIPPIGTAFENGALKIIPITLDDKLHLIREERNRRINAVYWAIQRHRDQLELEEHTTLSNAQYKDLLVYVQSLRDITGELDLGSEWRGIRAITWPQLNINVVVKVFVNLSSNSFEGSVIEHDPYQSLEVAGNQNQYTTPIK